MSDAQLTGMLVRQRVRNRQLLETLECIAEIVMGERDKHVPESAEWRRWNQCMSLYEKAKKEFGEIPQ